MGKTNYLLLKATVYALMAKGNLDFKKFAQTE